MIPFFPLFLFACFLSRALRMAGRFKGYLQDSKKGDTYGFLGAGHSQSGSYSPDNTTPVTSSTADSWYLSDVLLNIPPFVQTLREILKRARRRVIRGNKCGNVFHPKLTVSDKCLARTHSPNPPPPFFLNSG